MKVVLLTDLEGVAGVDGIGDLLHGEPGFGRAQWLLVDEIAAACAGLREGALAAGEVVVSDSHRGGPLPTVPASCLPPGATLSRTADGYGDLRLFEGAAAVACLGMHAADRGFAPHTVDLACAWEADGRPVSELDLFLGTAAERGVPAVFVAGDDALDARGLPFVATKTAIDATRARSRPPEEVRAAIRRAAAGRPQVAPAVSGELLIRFRSRWMAELAEAAGGVRRDETRVGLAAGADPSLGGRVSQATALIAAATAPLAAAFRRWARAEDAAALASRRFERTAPPPRQAEARRALGAFLARTQAPDDWSRAIRALTLHMLEGHAPAFFAGEGLAPVLAEAEARLPAVARDFPTDLDPAIGMARLDALYVLHQRGHSVAADAGAVRAYIAAVAERSGLLGWLLGELAAQIGLPGRTAIAARAYRGSNRVADLLWLTHLYLLETRYLRHALPAGAEWAARTEELLLAVPFTLASGQLDLAAEVAFCLVLAREQNAPERAQILAALAAYQTDDGTVVEPPSLSTHAPPPEAQAQGVTHCTAAALLAFATAV